MQRDAGVEQKKKACPTHRVVQPGLASVVWRGCADDADAAPRPSRSSPESAARRASLTSPPSRAQRGRRAPSTAEARVASRPPPGACCSTGSTTTPSSAAPPAAQARERPAPEPNASTSEQLHGSLMRCLTRVRALVSFSLPEGALCVLLLAVWVGATRFSAVHSRRVNSTGETDGGCWTAGRMRVAFDFAALS